MAETRPWHRIVWFWGAVSCMAAFFVTSSIPDDPASGNRILLIPPTIHNLLHVPAYGVLTGLWWLALRERGRSVLSSWAGAAVVSVAFGAFDELHQYFVPGRSMSVTDTLLNAAGALLVGLAVFFLNLRRH